MDNTLMLADLIELAGRLRQERLFILSEQLHLQELNEKVINMQKLNLIICIHFI